MATKKRRGYDKPKDYSFLMAILDPSLVNEALKRKDERKKEELKQKLDAKTANELRILRMRLTRHRQFVCEIDRKIKQLETQ